MMTFTFDELKLARERGYSDDEIWNTLSTEDNEIGLAKERGYSLEEVASITSGQPIPAAEPEPERREGGGITGGAADVGVSFMKGLGTGTRMISDVFGANNPVSKSIAGYEDYMDSLLSAESKKDSQEISRILKDAEGKGILPQIMAGLEAFTVAPAEMTATTMGMMLPNLAGGVYAKAAQLTKAGVLGLQMGIGAAQGAGSVKGQIYTAVQEELRQQGLPEDQIDKVATEAQAYNGKNLDQILIGAGLGAAASSTGAEKIMTRLITGAGKEATEGLIKSTIKGGLAEAPIEALQGGQEKVAENVALQRIGVDVPTMQGVIPAATMEATAGLLIGGGLGGVEAFVSPEKKEETDIDKQAQQTANEFLAPNDPTSQAMVKELARRENAVKNLQEAYDVLEPTSQEAQRLKLELGDAQRKLSAYKEIANKAGLSLPITTAEQQQIELAKQITEKPAEVTPQVTEVVAPITEVTPEVITPVTEVTPTTEVAAVTEVTPEVVTPAEVKATEITPTVKETLPVAPVEETVTTEAPAGVTKENFTQQKETIKVLNELTTIDRAALSGRLLSQGLITRAEALYNLQQASNEGITSQQISASRLDSEKKWNDRTGDGILAGRTFTEPAASVSADIAIRAEDARRKKRIVSRLDALNPKTVIGMTARRALKHASELNIITPDDVKDKEAIWRTGTVVKPNYALMQDAAAIIAEQDIPILDREKIVSLSSRGRRGRAIRFWGGDIGLPSTKGTRVQTLVHEVAHTLTTDKTHQVAPRNGGSGKNYIGLLKLKIADTKIEEPVRRLMGLYISTLEQLGIMDQYGKVGGLAGTSNADSSVNAARSIVVSSLRTFIVSFC